MRLFSLFAFAFSLLLSLSVPFTVLAVSYLPGQTLNPSCAPTDPTCVVIANTAGTFVATSSTATSTFAGNVSVSGTTVIGSLNGILKAVAGVITAALVNLSSDVTGILGIVNGGTGISSVPTFGQILVGDGSGGYALTATSSLGIVGSQWTNSGANVSYSGGNIGLGTTSPSALLTIDSSNATGTILRISNTSSGGHVFDLLSTGSGNTNGAGRLDIFDSTAGMARLSIAGNGNIGIGSTSPASTLTVNGTFTTAGTATFANAAPSPSMLRTELNPDVDLAKLEATSTPTVCFIGDSTVSVGNYISPIDSQLARIESALEARYPTKTFTFKDFSIGGTSLGQFTGTLSSGWPSWYTNHSATWNSYVAAAGCTSLFISYGLNDTSYENGSSWAGVFNDIVAYPTIPDIIISTNIVANPAAGGSFASAQYQAGYLGNAALQRSIALTGNNLGVANLPPIGVLDIGRYFNMAVFGRDPVEQKLSYVIPPTAPVVAGTTTTANFTYTLPETDGDFDLIFTLTNGSSFPTSGTAFNVIDWDNQGGNSTTYGGENDYGYLNFIPNGGTNLYVHDYAADNGIPNILKNTNNWSSTTNTIEVTLRDMHLQVTMNGAIAFDTNMPAAKTTFTPAIFLTSPPNGTVVTITSYAKGTMRQYTPIVSQSACYGSTGGTDSGNGINHVASDCLDGVYEPVIEAELGSGGLSDPTYTGSAGQAAYFSGFNSLAATSTLIFTPSGRIGIGTSTPYSRFEVWGPDTASTSAFQVVNSASTTEFTVYDTGNAVLAGSLTQNSDQRLKTNISDLDGSSSLAEINALNPVTFNWIDPAKSSVPQFGFIAQQVEQIFPNLVSTTSPTALTPDGTLSLNYIDLISPIIAAIQELDREVAALSSAIADFAQSITTHQINADELCLGSTCVTQSQLQALLAAANQSDSAPTFPSSQTSDATDTLPVIQINGANPAIIQAGASYSDLGATITGPQTDLNLDIATYLNGVAASPITIDTSAAATDTIAYVVTDQDGLTSTSTRTVVIEATASAATSSSATSTPQ